MQTTAHRWPPDPCELSVDAGLSARRLEQLTRALPLSGLERRARATGRFRLAEVHMGERQLTALCEQIPAESNRVTAAWPLVDAYENVMKHVVSF